MYISSWLGSLTRAIIFTIARSKHFNSILYQYLGWYIMWYSIQSDSIFDQLLYIIVVILWSHNLMAEPYVNKQTNPSSLGQNQQRLTGISVDIFCKTIKCFPMRTLPNRFHQYLYICLFIYIYLIWSRHTIVRRNI